MEENKNYDEYRKINQQALCYSIQWRHFQLAHWTKIDFALYFQI